MDFSVRRLHTFEAADVDSVGMYKLRRGGLFFSHKPSKMLEGFDQTYRNDSLLYRELCFESSAFKF